MENNGAGKNRENVETELEYRLLFHKAQGGESERWQGKRKNGGQDGGNNQLFQTGDCFILFTRGDMALCSDIFTDSNCRDGFQGVFNPGVLQVGGKAFPQCSRGNH
jgi:hypothetical protein